MKKLFENIDGNNFKLSAEGTHSGKGYDSPTPDDFPDKSDPVGQYLAMISDMPTDEPPPLNVWKIVVGNAEIALMKYKKQRVGLNQ